MEALEKDRYRDAQNCDRAEYICKSCGFGFRIGQSARVTMATNLFQEHRRYRDHKTMGAGVPEEVKQKFVEFLEGPMRRCSMRTWLAKFVPKFREARKAIGL
jgi:hypothetical protein